MLLISIYIMKGNVKNNNLWAISLVNGFANVSIYIEGIIKYNFY